MTNTHPNDVNAAFTAHFARFAKAAGRQSIIDAADTETDPVELLGFAEARFHGLVNGFAASFFDCWTSIGPPFRRAAVDALASRRGER